MEKRKNLAVVCLTAAFLLGFLVWSLLKPDDTVSQSERRKLAQKPELTAASVLNGTFMTDFESYTLDQFPLRDGFRRLKAAVLLDMLREKDNNGIYLADGYAAKLEYPLDESSVLHAAERFRTIYETYLSGTDARIYEAVIPDKGAFLARQNGYPSLDYSAFSALLQKNMPYAEAIDLMPVLSLNSYYRTDLHWRQEAIVPVASQLAEAMGVKLSEKYDTVTADTPFYGVYCGQSALPLVPDTLRYLTSETLRSCTVYDYETDSTGPVYALDALAGEDPYSVFLSGSKALLTITNPNAETDRELVIFRDSFASSLAPLLTSAYAKITLVDIRYVQPERSIHRMSCSSTASPFSITAKPSNKKRPAASHGRRAFCVRFCKNSCIKCVMSTISVRYVVKVLRFSPLKDTGKKTCICRNMWGICVLTNLLTV